MKGVNTMDTYSTNSFICAFLKKSIESLFGKCNLILTACIISFFFSVIALVSPVSAQTVLFDFDNAPLYSSLPIYQMAGGITAHLSATGQGYSIQNANVLGFTPAGFSGRIIYPNSIYLADLLIRFDHTLTDFSIMYCCQELGCDDAATMKVTAYMNGNYVGFNTRTATFPGTWPVDTLSCSFPQGFDSVVVHYYLHPPTCQDYGTIFLADNMRVTPLNATAISEGKFPEMFSLRQNYPNPFNPTTNIKFNIAKSGVVKIVVYDVIGREVQTLVNERLQQGAYSTTFDGTTLNSGVYFYRLTTDKYSESRKMLLIK
jgi:hypothetical protein